MRAVVVAIALGVLVTVIAAVPVTAQQPGAEGSSFSWDGESPFNCEIQDVGTGTDFPRPDDDPFCVRFDKTEQNLTAGGLLEFLLQEPARIAAAHSKCFYYQRDHWTGWVIQDTSPELYNFRGSYYFDRARGGGGVLIQDLRVGGMSPPEILNLFPIPNEMLEHFSIGPNGISFGGRFPGGGSFEPRCAERVSTPEGAAEVYRTDPAAPRVDPAGGHVAEPVQMAITRAARLGRRVAVAARIERRLAGERVQILVGDGARLLGAATRRVGHGGQVRIGGVLPRRIARVRDLLVAVRYRGDDRSLPNTQVARTAGRSPLLRATGGQWSSRALEVTGRVRAGLRAGVVASVRYLDGEGRPGLARARALRRGDRWRAEVSLPESAVGGVVTVSTRGDRRYHGQGLSARLPGS